ncbi:MAG: glutamate formiminotransferase, partial [Bacilli bacterium]|nr:glutamate formiminotransferase [Bacilli bacterium]
MNKVVECVPNFSEGKDLEKIDRIVAPLKNKENVKLVGVEPDAIYNRTVVTVIGEPEAVMKAIVESIGVAAQEIDLNKHSGEHKRMGATDV